MSLLYVVVVCVCVCVCSSPKYARLQVSMHSVTSQPPGWALPSPDPRISMFLLPSFASARCFFSMIARSKSSGFSEE